MWIYPNSANVVCFAIYVHPLDLSWVTSGQESYFTKVEPVPLITTQHTLYIYIYIYCGETAGVCWRDSIERANQRRIEEVQKQLGIGKKRELPARGCSKLGRGSRSQPPHASSRGNANMLREHVCEQSPAMPQTYLTESRRVPKYVYGHETVRYSQYGRKNTCNFDVSAKWIQWKTSQPRIRHKDLQHTVFFVFD